MTHITTSDNCFLFNRIASGRNLPLGDTSSSTSRIERLNLSKMDIFSESTAAEVKDGEYEFVGVLNVPDRAGGYVIEAYYQQSVVLTAPLEVG